MKQIIPSSTASSPIGLHGYGNAVRAVSQAWLITGLGCARILVFKKRSSCLISFQLAFNTKSEFQTYGTPGILSIVMY